MILFLAKLNVAFFISIAGDRFGSSDTKSIFNASDFRFGRDVNLSSLIVDVINLGESKNLNSSNDAVSNPLSKNDTSVPSALVPLIVLTLATISVEVPGVI